MSEDMQADYVADLDQEASDEHKFYVVAPGKFLVLYFVTFGLYTYYWFYKNWKQLKVVAGRKVIPFLRGLFHIVFAVQLFRTIDVELKARQLPYAWKPVVLAVTLIVLTVIAYLRRRLVDWGVDAVFLNYYAPVMLLVIGYVLYRAQMAVNLAMDDPKGLSNRRFTWANVIWILIGGLIWLMALVGAVLMLIHR